jgi:hypothetical protein
MNLTIRESDFVKMFRLEKSGVPDLACHMFGKYDLSYRDASVKELDEYVLDFLKLEETSGLVRTREENRLAFERGWRENLEDLKSSSPEKYELSLKPKYYRGSKFFRYDNRLVVTNNPQLEYELFIIARLCLFHQYLKDVETICELGCGTCANLLLISNMLPKTKLIGFDWTISSCEIAHELGKKLSKPISSHVFDMLEPDLSCEIPEGAAIISIHSFEQLGYEFEAVLEFILRSKPSIVMQYEPVLDFYDDNKLLDYLALRYCKRRGYLQGYYERLLHMESEGRIEIMAGYRPYLGGVLHESSVLVWKPLYGDENACK